MDLSVHFLFLSFLTIKINIAHLTAKKAESTLTNNTVSVF